MTFDQDLIKIFERVIHMSEGDCGGDCGGECACDSAPADSAPINAQTSQAFAPFTPTHCINRFTATEHKPGTSYKKGNIEYKKKKVKKD